MTPSSSNRAAVANLREIIDTSAEGHRFAYYKAHKGFFEGVLSLVDEYFKLGSVLELGPYPYHLTYLLNDKGYDVIGLDINPNRDAGAVGQHAASVADIRECDIERDTFPVDDDSVDNVLFTEVLEHLRINPLHTLREIKRVLKPDGRLLMTTPNLTSITNIDSYLSTGMITDIYDAFETLETRGHMGHVREYTAAEVRSLLEQTGFNVQSQQYHDWPWLQARDRTLKFNLGLLASRIIPRLRIFQVALATPKTN